MDATTSTTCLQGKSACSTNIFDFNGTAPQVRGNVNVAMAGLQA